MKWLQENSVVSMFLAFSIVFITYILVTDEHIAQYEQIEIEHGDTLWSLADQYRGKMTKQDWISYVTKENHLTSEHIVIGQSLSVPVEKESQYIVQQSSPDEHHSVKVASEK
ncbi:cell division suppressor protein YneA [Solibacillus sp. FSL H8-0538]|uniref:cell division suppressor protein YneA n=1 Tax=Solibacillus sp. FSL H8-0538 TaxID=2921400 RepID=UPI0030FAAFF0